jgi:hypothetical protein
MIGDGKRANHQYRLLAWLEPPALFLRPARICKVSAALGPVIISRDTDSRHFFLTVSLLLRVSDWLGAFSFFLVG